ncbi:MAG: hypothetical protein HYZ53_06310 [Planctomycetes bacterium]|nr:hypothetical protein [Planctomycetota bacterium]
MHRIHGTLAALNAAFLFVILGTGVTCWGVSSLPYAATGREPIRLHLLVGFLGAIFTCLVHVLVMFYLIGTGITIKDGVPGLPKAAEYIRLTKRFKGRSFPFATMSIAFVVAAAVIGGGAHTHYLPGWVHGLVATFAVLLNLVSFYFEFRVLRTNSELIREIDEALHARDAARRVAARPAAPAATPAPPTSATPATPATPAHAPPGGGNS